VLTIEAIDASDIYIYTLPIKLSISTLAIGEHKRQLCKPQTTILITCQDQFIIACSWIMPLTCGRYSCCTCRSWFIVHSTPCTLSGCNNFPSFLQWTAPVACSFCEGCTWHDLRILVIAPSCFDRRAQSFALWQQLTIQIAQQGHSPLLHVHANCLWELFLAQILFVVHTAFNTRKLDSARSSAPGPGQLLLTTTATKDNCYLWD